MREFSDAFEEAKTVLGGLGKLAKVCGVSYQAAQKWRDAGHLPRTEYTGETQHAVLIEQATRGKVSRWELLPPLKPKGFT